MCNKGDLPKEAKSANCAAIATFIFSVITLIGFLIPPYIGAAGGLLACIGTSIVMCCAGGKASGHTAAMVLCILGAICHLVGGGLVMYSYATVMAVTSGSASSAAVQGWISAIYLPTAIIQLVAGILDIVSAALCGKAMSALKKVEASGEGKPAA